MKTEVRARPQYVYRAPSGVWVTSCKAPQEDPWLRFGVVGYGLCSYRHLARVVWKEFRREMRAKKS